jgi:hypothetical protein
MPRRGGDLDEGVRAALAADDVERPPLPEGAAGAISEWSVNWTLRISHRP